jgi:ribosomal protein L29
MNENTAKDSVQRMNDRELYEELRETLKKLFDMQATCAQVNQHYQPVHTAASQAAADIARTLIELDCRKPPEVK